MDEFGIGWMKNETDDGEAKIFQPYEIEVPNGALGQGDDEKWTPMAAVQLRCGIPFRLSHSYIEWHVTERRAKTPNPDDLRATA